MIQRDEILSKVRTVPSLPAAALEAARIVQNPNLKFEELAEAIEFDPGLTADVLRLANSSYFGGMGRITSVRNAVIRMGTNAVFQMVAASAIGPLARKPVEGYDLMSGALWEHSVATAITTGELAKELKINAPDYTFTAGLLHDIGKIVLGTFIKVDSSPILDMAFKQRVSFDVAEREVLGIDHAEVGAVLLESWNLPKDIVSVVRWHHQPQNIHGEQIVGDLVHVADAFCMLEGLGIGNDGLNYRPSQQVIDRLGLEIHVTEKVICNTLITLEQVRTLFASFNGGEGNDS